MPTRRHLGSHRQAGWRARGWLDQAYPAIGRGADIAQRLVRLAARCSMPRALALAHFSGYEGKGTEDLFVCWHRWHPAGLRINVITIAHVTMSSGRRRKAGIQAIHPSLCLSRADRRNAGHLRTRSLSGGNSSDCTTTSPVWGHQQDRSDRLPTGAHTGTSFRNPARSVFAPLKWCSGRDRFL